MAELIINDSNYRQFINFQLGTRKLARGMEPRNFQMAPAGFYSTSSSWDEQIPLIPQDEWSDRIRQQEKEKSRLSDLRNFESLDQNGQGFCWSYSSCAAVMLLRAASNLRRIRLSPHAVACKIYNHVDRGAWGALSMEFLSKYGCPSEEFWPQQSMSERYDTEETWENALENRVLEGWMDFDVPAYDRQLTFDQIATLLLSRIPVVLDFQWWGHSVCGMDLVEVSPGNFGIRILNSWTDEWGNRGTAVLEGTRKFPMGACAARSLATAA